MAVKALLLLCAQALMLQTVWSQCLPGCGGFIPAASTGGAFVVTSSSPVAPIGVSVVSENVYDGALCVEGNLPLLGSVALEGAMGSAGAGAVSYGCGDGVAIVAEEGPIATGIAPEGGIGYGLDYAGYRSYGGFGIGGLFGGFGCGNGIYGLGYGNGLYGLGYGNGLYGFSNGPCGFGGFGGFGGYGYGGYSRGGIF